MVVCKLRRFGISPPLTSNKTARVPPCHSPLTLLIPFALLALAAGCKQDAQQHGKGHAALAGDRRHRRSEGSPGHLRVHRADRGLPRSRSARARDRHPAASATTRKARRCARARRCSRSTPRLSRSRSRAPKPTSASRNARLEQARRDVARLKPVLEAKAVSQKELDDATSAARVAEAETKSLQARLNEAKLNLGYTRVEAPISGVASRAAVSEGTLVSGPNVLLTTVTQTDPMYVIFGIPDREHLAIRRHVEEGRLKLPAGNRFKTTHQARRRHHLQAHRHARFHRRARQSADRHERSARRVREPRERAARRRVRAHRRSKARCGPAAIVDSAARGARRPERQVRLRRERREQSRAAARAGRRMGGRRLDHRVRAASRASASSSTAS